MAIRTRTDIKSFFQTGDKPTSGNYGDFIESTIFLNTTNTGSLNLQGTGSFEGGINCIPSDGEGSTGSFGMVSASGDISASGTGSFTGGINAIEGSGSFAYILGTLGTTAQPQITSLGTLTSLDVTGNISASGYISAGGNSILTGLPTTKPSQIGSLWLSGSADDGTSKHLVVFTG